MITLTPTRPGPRPVPPPPRPAPRPHPYPRPGQALTVAAGPGVQPGKGTKRPPGGGVLPPRPGWGGKGR